MTLTAKDVEEITRLLEESSFDELYLELDGLKLSLRRGAGTGPQMPTGQAAAARVPAEPFGGGNSPGEARAGAARPAARALSDSGASAPASPSSPVRAPSAAVDPASYDVPAPLLGTFYRAPKPGSPPFVEIGSRVEEETIVGIIEVMKLMNTVRAGIGGRVTEILAHDGDLVEFGQTLMRVGKSS